jgi:hypothetical protein
VLLEMLIWDGEEHAQVVLAKVKCRKTTCNCISHLELVENRKKIKQGTNTCWMRDKRQETTKHKIYTLKFVHLHMMHLTYMNLFSKVYF